MAQVIKVNVKEQKNLNKIPANNDDFKKKVMEDIEKKDNQPSNNVTHMLATVVIVGNSVRTPEVGEKVRCKKAGCLYPMGCQAIRVTNAEGGIFGYVIVDDEDALHGTVLDEDKFNILPDSFQGTVVEIGRSSYVPSRHLMMIALECEAPVVEDVFTVVSSGNSLLAPYGSIFTAKKEPRMNGSASVFEVYDNARKIGIIAPLHRMAIPGTDIMSLLEANNYPDTFQVKVVGDGYYDGTNRAIKVCLILPHAVKKFTAEEVAAADKKILNKYLAYLLREGECSTSELMMLSENGKKKKEMLDKRYREIVQSSAQKLRAYFELL